MIIISFDPGKHSYNYVLYNSDTNKVIQKGKFKETITDYSVNAMILGIDSIQKFINTLETLPDACVIETFIPRPGRVKGRSILWISFTNQALALEFARLQIPVDFYGPSVWKRSIRKTQSIPKPEKIGAVLKSRYSLKNQHQGDALGLALYYAWRVYG